MAGTNFSVPTDMTNVVLVVDDVELHVSKEYLAMHSPVFKTMFFGDFAERGQDEFEIRDVFYEEFVDLLNVIHPGRFDITVNSVSHILKLADQFDMKDARDQSETFLMNCDQMHKAIKLSLADKYKMPTVTTDCLNSFKCINDMRVLKSSRDFERFSDATKAAIGLNMIGLMSAPDSAKPGCCWDRCGLHDPPKPEPDRRDQREERPWVYKERECYPRRPSAFPAAAWLR